LFDEDIFAGAVFAPHPGQLRQIARRRPCSFARKFPMVPEQIANPSFTSAQKEYLRGFFAGVAQRGAASFVGHTATGLITADAASGVANEAAEREELYFGTPVSELCREEAWKHDENALDIWDKLIAHAAENKAPAPDDLFRFKFHGLFHVAPAQDSFMLRLRVPGSILSTHQLRGLADLAADCGSGRVDITTRSNLQIREFQPKDIIRVLATIQALGMSSRGSGADNIRNITASPITGLDPEELLDVAPLAEALNTYILNSRDMYGLPRKFNVAFDNGGTISVVADTNDIGFMAVRVNEGQDLPPGIYFRVVLCGITGHKQFASDCGLLLRPDQTVAVAAAMIRVFSENGNRTDRKKARLKYLIDKWGVEKFLAETEKRLAFPLVRFPADACEPRKPIDRAGHIGVHAQQQPGRHYIGVVVPVGRLPVAQALAVADIADRFGSGEVRLTVWQNLVIPNIATNHLEAAKGALLAAGLDFTAGRVLSGTVACTGSKGCRFAATDTKSHAVVLANFLDERFQIDQPINLHVTGCPHSCAQHYIGDIGLLGTKVGGEEGYQVVIGGGSDHDQGIGRELIPSVRFGELSPVMERLFQEYTSRRNPDESFLNFTRRHSITDLQSFCRNQEHA
jgi:ferredoxin-nitrite reductase